MPLSLSQKLKYEEGELVAMKTVTGSYIMGIVTKSTDARATVTIVKNGIQREFSHRDLFFLNNPDALIV